MRRLSAAVLMGAVLLSGCATYEETKMVPADSGGDVRVRFAQGDALMLSLGDRGAVMLAPARYTSGDSGIYFRIAAYNGLADSINFGPEDIDIHLDDGAPVQVLDFDALRHDAKMRAEVERADAAIVASVNAWNAARVTRSDPQLGDALYRGNAQEYAYRMGLIEDYLTTEIISLDRTVLQTTTIDPQSAWGGRVIAIQPPLSRDAARTIDVQVTFAGEPHRFRLLIARDGTPTPAIDLPAPSRERTAKLLNTPPTWLWNVPPPPAPMPAGYVAHRF